MKVFIFLVSACVLLSFANTKSNTNKKFSGQRIINGDEAKNGQFRFAAAIYITTPSGKFFCGGTLLTNQWILTAAQCVNEAIHFDIQLGSLRLDGNSSYTVKVSTDSYVQHPEYDPLTLINDIALIHLRLPVEFSNYLSPVDALPSTELAQSSSATAIGWGQMSDGESGLVDTLRAAHVKAWSNEECRIVYGNQIKDNMVCVGGNWNEGTCFGDSGSALVQYGNQGRVQVSGVASFFSQNGCESTDPSGFTRVYPYIDWIKNITNKTN